VDLVLVRSMDGPTAFPAILLAIALMAARGPGAGTVIFALSVVYTPRTAMLIRSTVLSIRELDYVQAARALGRRDLAIAFRHILPNCVGPLLVQASFIFAYAILAEAILGFLGVGVPPYVPSWGNVTARRHDRIRQGLLGHRRRRAGPRRHRRLPQAAPEGPRRVRKARRARRRSRRSAPFRDRVLRSLPAQGHGRGIASHAGARAARRAQDRRRQA